MAALGDEDMIPAPELPDWLAWVWRAWSRLGVDRPHLAGGMGPARPQRIPWSDLQRWCAHHGYGADDLTFLDRCCAALDEVYLAWWSAQQKSGGT